MSSLERPTSRRRTVLVALVLLALLTVPAVSYTRALTYPGSAPWSSRSVDWLRAHGGSPLVNMVENWYYTRHAPPMTRPDPGSLPAAPGASAAAPALPARRSFTVPRAVPALVGSAPLPGEGRWVARRTTATGVPVLYTTFLRPDPRHAGLVAGAAWVRAGATTAHLVAGTVDPPSGGWPGQARVDRSDVRALVATFNSGFRLKDINGGFYELGRAASPLVPGDASAVLRDNGAILVGQWGRDVRMSPHVVAVRQNLHLVVDGGVPVDGLASNADGRWGSPKNQYQYTWRSGLGTDARGDLVYVAGNFMNLQTLATAMADCGVVRGMELDMHRGMVSFSSWQPAGGRMRPTKLLPTMTRPADRYLAPDQRDFFYLTLR
jgi:hypothetical protein